MNTTNTTAMSSPLPLRRMFCRNRRGQCGVVAIEFALVLLFGLLPLLLLTFSGVLVFAAKQSLTLAASDGARAALHYNPNASNGNLTDACSAALRDMNWLFELGGTPAPSSCTSGSISTNNTAATITADNSCTTAAGATSCVTVTTTYNYENSPLVLGTGSLYGWFTNGKLQSTATIQIYNN